MAQPGKNLPAVEETRVLSLGGEDTLEENGNPHQYSCLEKSMDRGAWQACVESDITELTHTLRN